MVTEWPLAQRMDVVRAYAPQTDSMWVSFFDDIRRAASTTAGVRVTFGPLLGTDLFVFSSLNVDAARFLRLGHLHLARECACAAARLEGSALFAALTERLSELPTEVALMVLDGSLPRSDRRTWSLLVALAEGMESERAALRLPGLSEDVVRGVVERLDATSVTVMAGERRKRVPRWLAERAHRDAVGQWIVVVTERSGDRDRMSAFPGIDVSAGAGHETGARDDSQVTRPAYPYDRDDPRVNRFSDAALAHLRKPRRRVPLVVPVVIDE